MVVLNCRFILDLREAAAPAEYNTRIGLTGTTNQETTGVSVAFRPLGRDTTTIISSVYGATILWVSHEAVLTIPSEDTLEIELSERMRMEQM